MLIRFIIFSELLYLYNVLRETLSKVIVSRLFYERGVVMVRSAICTSIGVIGSGVAYLFGGFDNAIITLLLFMVIDYITGLIVAGVFHNSTKTETGSLESKAGWKGLCKKGVTLLIVVIANRLDMQLGSNYIRDTVCIGFMLNELISIIENAGLMGIKLPTVLTKAIEILKQNESEG